MGLFFNLEDLRGVLQTEPQIIELEPSFEIEEDPITHITKIQKAINKYYKKQIANLNLRKTNFISPTSLLYLTILAKKNDKLKFAIKKIQKCMNT